MDSTVGKIPSYQDSVNAKENSKLRTRGFLSDAELDRYIDGCAANDRLSQKKIYSSFYGYAKAISDFYSSNNDDSSEILNDGFLKIFKEIHRYKPAYADPVNSFKGWLRRIMIYTAIDHFRRNKKHRMVRSIDTEINRLPVIGDDVIDRISYDQLRKSIQELTPGYRVSINLHFIEGFTHQQIAKHLGISVGASKSNVARGRRQLQQILLERYGIGVNDSSENAHASGEDPAHGAPLT